MAIRDAVVFVGPLPNPLHGFSAVNLAVYNQLKERTDEVLLFNRSCSFSKLALLNFGAKIIFSLCQYFYFFLSLFFIKYRSIYLGLSGGYGKIFDIPFILVSRIFRINIFIHHHSYAYINDVSKLAQIVFRVAGAAQHIVLCERMALTLADNYQIDSARIASVSNAAFQDKSKLVGQDLAGDVCLGFLSNITEEKGIFEFFETVQLASRSGLRVKAKIAGPVSAEIRDKFEQYLSATPEVTYCGPVYGTAKDDFLQSLHFLLFPTKYVNEAEPVTILEAMRYGVPVFAVRRGCIEAQIGNEAGFLIDDISRFSTEVCHVISQLNQHAYHQLRSAAACRFDALAKVSRGRIETLLEAMVNG